MPRPKTISDQRLIEATSLVIGRAGPGFTLAMVAEEAGVSVGTVAGRFGSKAGLLRALTERGIDQAAPVIRAAWDAEPDPVAGLRAAATVLHAALGDAREAANHLGQLGVDLQDPVLRELLGRYYAAMEAELAACCAAAREGLPGMPAPPVAARVLLGLANGAALDWSIRPLGTLADRLGEDVDAVLACWRRG
ncbi:MULTISPECIES: TetR/AcrR family transcriptional regulator [Actinokineospora]|uniref:TetR family transcriptional regulator n=1 Tax=Actinokineospora fastidiosa TaxID=1816 RepID=A0A918G6C8_9PSEU|nr:MULTISPECIES: TetR/AcrR family transcriptional regulator [Actinokineospora]GGS19600.1 TetR family transcriptional regulator [Actinokineospora fastidiosa]